MERISLSLVVADSDLEEASIATLLSLFPHRKGFPGGGCESDSSSIASKAA